MSDITNFETNDQTIDEATETPVEETVVTPAVVTPADVTPAVVTPAAEPDTIRANPRKVREGIVISDKMNATLVVAVNERVSHPRYGKTVQRTKKLYVHDEKNEAKIGDKVRVQETRPLSKLKRWRLTEVVERAR
jgi:small subunit ribosomal protein S17